MPPATPAYAPPRPVPAKGLGSRGDPFAKPATRRPVDPYLRTRVMTASPEQLQLMLFDGAIRFGEQAKTALEQRKFDESYEKLSKAQSIVGELQAGLRPERDPDTCGRLNALYTWCFMRLVEANFEQDAAKVEEALRVLRFQRETWAMLARQRAGEAQATPSEGIRLAG